MAALAAAFTRRSSATAASTCKPYDWKCQQAYNRQALRPGNAHFNAERQRSGGDDGETHPLSPRFPYASAGKTILRGATFGEHARIGGAEEGVGGAFGGDRRRDRCLAASAQPPRMMYLRPILSDNQPKKMKNGVPSNNAIAINVFVVAPSTSNIFSRKNIA